MGSLNQTEIEALQRARIFFGHQSVGGNVLAGLSALSKEDPALAKIRVVELNSNAQTNGPAIYHCKVGKNRDPQSKLAAFEEILVKKGLGDAIDAALMKFCYVDIYPDTDIEKVFKDYVASAERIQKYFNKLTLIHATCPLTVHGGGLKKTIKNWLKGDQVNIARAKYNALIREKYGKTGVLFDIATAEATRPDGSRVTFSYQGQTCEAAEPAYTDGVGHLNETGGQHVAEAFLKAIAAAVKMGRTGASPVTAGAPPAEKA